MNTTPNHAAYTLTAAEHDVLVYASSEHEYGTHTLGQSAVLLTTKAEATDNLVQASLNNLSELTYLEKVVQLCAADSLPKTARDTQPQVTVSYEQAAAALYEHLGHRQQLLTPAAAIRLAGAAVLAAANQGAPKLFSVLVETVPAHQTRQSQFRARARRRIHDQEFGRHMSPWPIAEQGAS